MKTLICLFIVLVSVPGVSAPLCKSLYSSLKLSVESKKVFSGFIKSPKEDYLYGEVRVPKRFKNPKGFYLLLHGLLDSSSRWGSVEQGLLEAGYGVIKLDLLGHGKSLERHYKEKGDLSKEIDYRDQLEAIMAFLKLLKKDYSVERPNVMGHSYGGGLAMALAAHPQYSKAIGNQLVLVAPYVYRLDHYHQIKTVSDSAGFFTGVVEAWTSEIVKNVGDKMDPITDGFVKDGFSEYLQINGMSSRVEESVAVDAALAVTKGIRDFDARVDVEQIRKVMDVRLIIGSRDTVSPEALEVELYNSFVGGAKKSLLNIMGAGHLLTTEAPGVIINWILPEFNQSIYKSYKKDNNIFEVPFKE